jgi:hypothetical protein
LNFRIFEFRITITIAIAQHPTTLENPAPTTMSQQILTFFRVILLLATATAQLHSVQYTALMAFYTATGS